MIDLKCRNVIKTYTPISYTKITKYNDCALQHIIIHTLPTLQSH